MASRKRSFMVVPTHLKIGEKWWTVGMGWTDGLMGRVGLLGLVGLGRVVSGMFVVFKVIK